jgi:hypothetical protein
MSSMAVSDGCLHRHLINLGLHNETVVFTSEENKLIR